MRAVLFATLDFVAYFDDTVAEYIQQECVVRASLEYHLLIVAPAERHKQCLRRTGNGTNMKVFESYAKARTALEGISVKRFLNV
ncbi:MAG: hypothetical protein HFP81_02920 [Methylococcales symbiont of Hymedesmia sp. n. MRB-2018]|nr:MAG: hypothetical protein HFP78_06325 [Methylococcales symbiont of Hymedesmia sp. n. MRB-2018]KAF3984295.1 MAG: hypothetical protein HFP81_02920 [Methylococcales symbiont of Hymedesmia sp. n. MRB-2018]